VALAVLTGVLIAAAAHAQEAHAIKVVRSWILAAPDLPWTGASNPTHGLRLALITMRETAWDPDAILAAMRNMTPLLAQCGVRIVEANLQLVDAPPRFRFYRTPVAREFTRLLPVPRPAIYFVADTLNRPAFDAEAIGRANSANRPELADSIWVAAGTRDLHVALAHELAHVLMDSGEHSDETGNLMLAETAAGNTRLTDSQCARIRETGERNGLLTLLQR
jgi:hypothetical protein